MGRSSVGDTLAAAARRRESSTGARQPWDCVRSARVSPPAAWGPRPGHAPAESVRAFRTVPSFTRALCISRTSALWALGPRCFRVSISQGSWGARCGVQTRPSAGGRWGWEFAPGRVPRRAGMGFTATLCVTPLAGFHSLMRTGVTRLVSGHLSQGRVLCVAVGGGEFGSVAVGTATL